MTLKHLRRLLGKHCARVYLVNPSQAARVQAMSVGGYPVPHTRLMSVPIPDGERRLSVLFWVRD